MSSVASPRRSGGILLGFVTHVIFILLVVILSKLLEDVDKSHATLMVLLVSIGVAVALANLLNGFAPVVLLGGADYLSVFTNRSWRLWRWSRSDSAAVEPLSPWYSGVFGSSPSASLS